MQCRYLLQAVHSESLTLDGVVAPYGYIYKKKAYSQEKKAEDISADRSFRHESHPDLLMAELAGGTGCSGTKLSTLWAGRGEVESLELMLDPSETLSLENFT